LDLLLELFGGAAGREWLLRGKHERLGRAMRESGKHL
jgi:hypothetical protein